MPPTLVANDILSVRTFCYMQNQAGINQFWFRVSSVGGTPAAQAIADAISTSVAPAYKQWIATIARYEGLKMYVIRGVTKFLAVQSVQGAGTGLPGSEPQPKQVTGLTTKTTDFAGRAYRGRAYWPFPARDVADTTGAPSLGQKAAMDALSVALLTSQSFLDGANFAAVDPVVIHKNPAVAPTLIVGYRVSPKWATQRRRGDYGRPNLALT